MAGEGIQWAPGPALRQAQGGGDLGDPLGGCSSDTLAPNLPGALCCGDSPVPMGGPALPTGASERPDVGMEVKRPCLWGSGLLPPATLCPFVPHLCSGDSDGYVLGFKTTSVRPPPCQPRSRLAGDARFGPFSDHAPRVWSWSGWRCRGVTAPCAFSRCLRGQKGDRPRFRGRTGPLSHSSSSLVINCTQ